MWPPVLLLLCLCCVSSQPVADNGLSNQHIDSDELCLQSGDQDGLSRRPRELIECCPCSTTRDNMAAGSQLSRLDDCPCARSADSEGASSFLFPTSARTERPFMRSFDPTNDEQKHLLEPEVSLATSMLETLREATEEEYQDALVRDAARASVLDGLPEESKNLVIIVNPKDEMVSEASHNNEARCIHPMRSPFERSAVDRVSARPMKGVPEFRMPRLRGPSLHRNLFDMDSNVGASNVQEKVANHPFRRVPLFSPKIANNPFGVGRADDSHLNNLSNGPGSEITSTSIKPLIPKLKLPNNFLKHTDHNLTPSNIQKIVSSGDRTHITGLPKRPLQLRNLLKLKDVELVPKHALNSPRKLKLDKPLRTLPAFYNKEAEDDCIINKIGSKLSARKVEDTTGSSTSNDEVITDYVDTIKNVFNDGINAQRETSPNEDIKETSENNDATASASDIQPSFLKSKEIDADEDSLEIVSSEKDEDSESPLKTPEVMDNTSMEEDDLTSLNIFEENSVEITTLVPMPKENINTDEIKENVPLDSNELAAEDSESDGSNNNPIVELPERDAGDGSCEDKNISRESTDEPEATPSQFGLPNKMPKLPLTPLSDTLSNIRENVQKTLDKLKIAPNKIVHNNVEIINEVPSINSNLGTNSAEQGAEDTNGSSLTDRKDNEVTFTDLQKLSNDLLHESTNRAETTSSNCMGNPTEEEFKSSDPEEKLEDEELEPNKSPKESEDFPLVDDSSNNFEARECLVTQEKMRHAEENDNIKSIKNDEESKEMDVGASEPVIKIFDPLNLKEKLASPLIPDLVQPKLSSDPLNLFSKPLEEVLNLKPVLPSLDDVRGHLSNIFEPNDRSVEDLSCDNEERMTPEASVTNSQRNIPSLKPLQDFNVDLFKINPVKPDGLSFPKNNLKSYRAKLPAPTNLDLKPIKPKSILRNEDGIFGASNKLNNKNTLRKSASSPFDVLKQPLPTFDDLRDSLNLNPGSLFDNPLKPGLNLMPDSGASISDITENLRRNAEKTRKSIEKRMRTLQGQRTTEPLAKPQEFFEDVGDKLKAIHYDLNDRITSLHEDLFDNNKLKSLPTLNPTDFRSIGLRPVKLKPIKLQSAASSLIPQNTDPRDRNSERKFPNRSNLKKPSKLQRLESAASAPAPVKVEMPNHKSPFLPSPFLSHQPSLRQFGEDRLDLNRDFPIARKPNIDSIRRPVFRQPFKDSKFTISFGSTTPAPIIRDSSQNLEKPSLIKQKSIDVKKQHVPRNQITEIEPPTRHLVGPSLFSNNIKTLKDPLVLNRNTPTAKQSNSFPITRFENRPNLRNAENFKPAAKSSSFPWPTDRNADNVLTKVRDTVKGRLAGFDPIKVSKEATQNHLLNTHALRTKTKAESSNTDMARSASNNDLAVIDEPLKENVSYKCQLVCTKEQS